MKKSSLKTLLFVISVSLFVFTGCKKYEDGPLISFKSKMKRLEGEWRLVYQNGDDVFSIPPKLYFKFEEDGTFTRTEVGDNTISYTGTWVWESRKEIIEVDLRSPDNIERIDYRISKLTSDALWIEDNYINDYQFQKED